MARPGTPCLPARSSRASMSPWSLPMARENSRSPSLSSTSAKWDSLPTSRPIHTVTCSGVATRCPFPQRRRKKVRSTVLKSQEPETVRSPPSTLRMSDPRSFRVACPIRGSRTSGAGGNTPQAMTTAGGKEPYRHHRTPRGQGTSPGLHEQGKGGTVMVCWVLQGLQDFRAVPVQGHRRRAERAADLPCGGGAGDAVVAVGVVAGEAAEFVAGGLGGLRVMLRALLRGGGAGQRPELEQGAGGARAVEAAVGDDRAGVGAPGAAVVGVQVLDELRARGAQRGGPVLRDAV